jgi:hypothetical protein
MADDLDETIEESFPASDAPANTPETGIGVDGSSADDAAAGDTDDKNGAKPAGDRATSSTSPSR